MVPYELIYSNAANVSGKDLIVIHAGQYRSFFIAEIETWGDGTSSAYSEFGIFVPSALGSTPPTAVAPAPPDARLPAFSGVYYPGTWTSQATIPSVPVKSIGINGNGQHNLWRPANPLSTISVPAAGGGSATAAASLCIRPTVGAALFNTTTIIRIIEV